MTRPVIIYKYRLGSTGRTTVSMPQHAQLLSVQNQDELVQVWALCNPAQHVLEHRHFVSLKTGDDAELDETARFLGTVQLNKGRFVPHIFEVPTP